MLRCLEPHEPRMLFPTCAKLNVKIVLTYNVDQKAAKVQVCAKSASPGGSSDR